VPDSVAIRKYIASALSPIHIGSRNKINSGTDLSIARDVDNLPIIPASTIRGCARAYSFLDYGLRDCDAKGQQCPQPHICASCSVYGYLSYRQNQGLTSLVRFSDGQLIFIPFQTNIGMVWLSSDRRLVESGIIPSKEECDHLSNSIHFPDVIPVAAPLTHMAEQLDLRLGSFRVRRESIFPINVDKWIGPSNVRPAYDRCIVVPEEQYGAIANNALSVFTSVAIDSATGAVKAGALYTIEGVPRSSIFIFQVGYLNPETQGIDRFVSEKTLAPIQLNGNLDSLIQIVESGLTKFSVLGIGGKRSRGFGRLEVWAIATPQPEQPHHREERKKEKENRSPIARPTVFLSHSSQDKLFVRKLARDLQEKQIKPWLDEREILVGDSLHGRIAEGIEKTDFLILILSDASIKSGWVEREVNAALMRELEKHHVVVLPVLKDPIGNEKIPPLLRDRVYADFCKDYDIGFHALLTSIRGHKRRRNATITN
jgi:CRISPR/Cas system CMR subunit Cmr4 (Cas7 group RAMP superfamily)